jgi:amidase
LFAFNQPGTEELAPLAAVIEQERRRQAARAAWSGYFAQVDVFVCPTNFTAAFPHDPRPFQERTIAELLEDVTGGFQPPPRWERSSRPPG